MHDIVEKLRSAPVYTLTPIDAQIAADEIGRLRADVAHLKGFLDAVSADNEKQSAEIELLRKIADEAYLVSVACQYAPQVNTRELSYLLAEYREDREMTGGNIRG